MKRYFNIFVVAVFLISLSSCESEIDSSNETDNDVLNKEDIILPAGNFISFYTDIETRASLLTEQYITQPFGVFGYQYDFNNTWNGQRAMAKPNVFWNLNNGGGKLPLKVSYANGSYNYRADGPQDNTMASNGQVNWTSNRYAFWAYYPYEGYDPSYFSVSGMEIEGAPYITYQVDRTTTQNMYDVMTGGISQITAASSGNTVTFTMQHRLSAVDVSISNAYEHEYTKGKINYTEDVDIIIEELQLQFNKLKYTHAKIFLEKDKNIPALNTVLTPASTEANMSATYLLVGSNSDIASSVTIEPTATEKTNLTAKNGATMTFIPQETTDLSVTAIVKYHMEGKDTQGRIPHLRVNEDGEPIDKDNNKTDDSTKFVYDGVSDNETTGAKSYILVSKTTDFNQPLVEGTRYYIVLNFTSEAVSINIITAETWDERTIDYEFK